MDLLQTIARLKASNQLPRYIDYVIFPHFKDLSPFTRIDFTHPFTVFVGANGTRKSSVLKGIYGSPKGYTIERYWFATSLDPITDPNTGLKNSVIHAYKNEDGEQVECLKTHTEKTGRRLDYWEPTKPSQRYKMGSSRASPIDKNVVYLDFRACLPAFDKCFHFRGKPNVQDYLRQKSKLLKKALSTKSIVTWHTKPRNRLPIELNAAQVAAISKILNKPYEAITYIHHEFFDGWGGSVYLKAKYKEASQEYSEAFAGSGENAVVTLVLQLSGAANGSLVILDEPEVSLHPEAQKRLREYLFEQIKLKKHQVILSTHSPTMIDGLPPEAIKVFVQEPERGFTRIIPNIGPLEAFEFIGQALQPSQVKRIWVEDKLAKELVEGMIRQEFPTVGNTIEVQLSGNREQMFKQASAFCHDRAFDKNYLVIDKDPGRPTEIPNPDGFTSAQSKDLVYLNEQIATFTGLSASDKLGLNIPPDADAAAKRNLEYLTFLGSHLFFLNSVPEEIIWNREAAKNALRMKFAADTDLEAALGEIEAPTDYKERFNHLCLKLYGESDAHKIFGLQQLLVTYFLTQTQTSEAFQELRATLENIRQR